MDKFSIKKLIETEGAIHKELFSLSSPAWEGLNAIDELLSALPKTINSDCSDAYLENEEMIHVGKNCVIEPTAMIVGPCYIGDNCEIRHGSYIRENCIIGNNVVIGHATEIVRSVVFDGAKMPHFNYVGDSIIGRWVNLGAGVRLANYRLDGEEITFFYEGELYKTGRNKFGSILGDGVSIGCNSVLNPGTIIFPRKTIVPCKSIRGVVHC